jgi:outer membrane protein TolC
MKKLFFPLCFISAMASAQQRNIPFFTGSGIQKNPTLLENTNLLQNFQIQREIITAQNKKPQVSITADYLFAPFFFDNGRVISITTNPSPKAYGYDAGITNGGLYAAQLNVAVPLFNNAILNNLYAQNKAESAISANNSKQTRYDAEKGIIDQYILAYQFLEQTTYLQKIIDRLKDRKPLVEALVKKGLLQQNDYLLLDIQLLNSENDLKQMQFAYVNGVNLLKNLALIGDTTTFILERPDVQINPDPQERFYLTKYKLDSLNIIAQQNVFNNKYHPQFSLIGTTGINATDITNVPHNVGLSAAFHVGIPISDGKQRKLNDKSVEILLKNQSFYKDNAQLLLENNLRNAKQQISQWKETVVINDGLIQKQELLLDIIKDKVVKGQVTVMDYINALQDYNVMLKNRAIAETNVLLYINQYNYYNH